MYTGASGLVNVVPNSFRDLPLFVLPSSPFSLYLGSSGNLRFALILVVCATVQTLSSWLEQLTVLKDFLFYLPALGAKGDLGLKPTVSCHPWNGSPTALLS